VKCVPGMTRLPAQSALKRWSVRCGSIPGNSKCAQRLRDADVNLRTNWPNAWLSGCGSLQAQLDTATRAARVTNLTATA